MTIQPVTLQGFAEALGSYAADLFDVPMTESEIVRAIEDQLDRDLFESGLQLGEIDIDSVALVELLANVEAELDISIFDVADVDEIASLRGLATAILRAADESHVVAFMTARGG